MCELYIIHSFHNITGRVNVASRAWNAFDAVIDNKQGLQSLIYCHQLEKGSHSVTMQAINHVLE
jgi:hypothetical protein